MEKGGPLPRLHDVVLVMGPGEVGGPVQVGDVWHLVMMRDVRESQHVDIADEKTLEITQRQYLHDKLDEYTVSLLEKEFTVMVYKDKLIHLAQHEADMVKLFAEKAQQPGSETERRIRDFQQLYEDVS